MRRLLIALFVLALLALAPVALLRSERVVLALAHWGIERFTDLRLELKNPRILPMRGLLSADEIHLYPKSDDGPPFVSILEFEARVDADDLYFGNLVDSDLSAGKVIIYVSDRDSTSDPEPIQWLRYLGWLPRNLRMGQMHLITASESTYIFPLKDVRGARFAGTDYHLTAMAHYEGEPQDMRLTLSVLREDARFARINLEGDFIAPDTGSSVHIAGELRGSIEDFSYDFAVEAAYSDVSEFLQGFEGGEKLAGQLDITANMSGDGDGYDLKDARLVLDNMPEYGIESAGSMRYEFSGDSEIALVASGELSSLGYVVDWVEADLSLLGRALASATLSGSLDHPVIDEFILRTESADGLTVNVRGRLEPPGLRQSIDNRIKVDVQGPDLSVLERFVGELPELPKLPGGWRSSAELIGQGEQIAVHNFLLELGTAQTLKLTAQGSAGNIAGTQDAGLAALQDLKLKLGASSPDIAYAGELFDVDLPPYFELEGTVELQGDADALLISGGEILISSSDIELNARPRAGTLHLQQQPILQGLQADLELLLSDTSALSQYSDAVMPALGAVTATARLTQKGEHYSLQHIAAQVRGELLTLTSRGGVEDLQALSGVVLHNQISQLDTRSLLMTALADFHYPHSLGTLEGEFTLARPNGTWRALGIDLHSSEPGGRLDLSIRGELNDLTGESTGQLDSDFYIRDTALLETLTGLPMNPLSGYLDLNSEPGALGLAASARIGETDLQVEGSIGHASRAINALRLSFHSPQLNLEDIGLQAQAVGKEEYRPVESLEEVRAGDRIEALLARSPRYPSDIAIRLDGISGDNTNIQSLDAHITGVDNRYTLRRFSLAYANAQAEIRGIIDLNPSPPAISLAGEALTIPLNTLGRDLGLNTEITGELSLRGGLTAMGHDTEQLTATLNGSLALALEDAVIAGAAYDVLATDLLAWVYSGAALEESTRIDCTMGEFLLQDGVATSDSLYIETRKMVAKGKAKLDLVRQKMDVEITPRSKSRSLQVPSSVRLRGSFDDPRPIISPVTAAADAYTSFLTLVPRLAMKMFGVERRKGKQRPCET